MKHQNYNAWLLSPTPFGAEIFAKAGFHSVTVDMQHGMLDFRTAIDCFRGIALHGSQPWVRVAANDPALITKVLDAGALGVICPLISTPKQADDFVKACHYQFDGGNRSFGPVRAALVLDDYVARSAKLITAMAMIETQEGFDNVEAIAATPGLNGLFIGPADLALAFGIAPTPENRDPDFLERIDHIIAAAHDAGILCGMFAGTPEYARDMLTRGMDMVSAVTDTQILLNGAQSALTALGGPTAKTHNGY
ncbi:aldolase/citrate lyase family protein [Desulfovibrio sp. UCD-KL4C]|uniref:HpcH/HpaI aldolase family protein n=1 Tax=Desulfovibrio sp. UCD-KL4C TaxID=2578120 RepID=UPI0025B84B43|nr:aldolase/citrate lyase family protein [Desulfovibrio sp. UCD-KL4C]